MANITLKGNPFHTQGNLPSAGSKAPNFSLVAADLSEKSLADFAGQRVVLNIFPSIDTSTCATSVRKFNELVGNLPNTQVLCVSKDLPFASSRFCGAEGIENVQTLSDFRGGFDAYQAGIIDGPLKGLLSRAIVVIDEQGQVLHSQQVPEIVDEPDYELAISKLH